MIGDFCLAIFPYYDVKLVPTDYPLMNLSCISYIRSHKQTVTHHAAITKIIVNIKKEYPELYKMVIDKVEQKYRENIVEARGWVFYYIL